MWEYTLNLLEYVSVKKRLTKKTTSLKKNFFSSVSFENEHLYETMLYLFYVVTFLA